MRVRKSITAFQDVINDLDLDCPIYGVNYCKLQTFLRLYDADYYLAEDERVNDLGWRDDVYIFSDFVIITGYQPFGVLLPNDFCEFYEILSKNIWDNYYSNLIDHKQLTNLLHILMMSFKKGAELYAKRENELNNFKGA